jgi:hypothetical protein
MLLLIPEKEIDKLEASALDYYLNQTRKWRLASSEVVR